MQLTSCGKVPAQDKAHQCMDHYVPAICAAGGYLAALLCGGSSPRCVCEVKGPSVDLAIIELLQRQLDRCGPANLTQHPTVDVSGLVSVSVLPPTLLAGVVIGLVFGVLLASYIRRVASAPPSSAAPSASSGAAPLTPSRRRAQQSVRSLADIPADLLG